MIKRRDFIKNTLISGMGSQQDGERLKCLPIKI